MAKQQATEYTPAQKAAYNAGMGYVYGKAGKRVPVKPENQSSFRKGNEVAKSKLGIKQKPAAKPRSTFSMADKVAYYSRRVNDGSLTAGQRRYAAQFVVDHTYARR